MLFGSEYWHSVIDFDVLVRHGTIDKQDLDHFHVTDSVDDAYHYVVAQLERFGLAEPGATL